MAKYDYDKKEQATSTNTYSKKNYKMNFAQARKSVDKKTAHYVVKPDALGGVFEFKMPAKMIEELLKSKGLKGEKDVQAFLCNYVNQELGILGNCIRVISE